MIVRRIIVFALLSAAPAILAACASDGDARRSHLPPPPSETVRAQLAPVRVSVTVANTAMVFEGPAKGAGEGALRGAETGAVTPAAAGAVLENPFTVIVGILLAPVGAAVGAVSGAVNAEPAAAVEKNEAAFKTAAGELDTQGTFTGCVDEAVRRTLSPGASSLLGGEDASTVLEIVIEKLGLVGGGINPPLSFVMTEQSRLIRLSDGAELYRHWLAYRGRPRLLDEWAARDGAALREEASRACRELAERLVDEVFLLYLPAKEQEQTE